MNKISLAALLLLAAPALGAAQAREEAAMTEREAAAALMEGRITPERDRALALALELGPRAGPELRAALIDAAWAELRGEVDRPENSEAIIGYHRAVIYGQDPRGIPFLLAAGGGGGLVPNALANFGPERAFAPLLEIATGAEEHDNVTNALTALRFMIEDGSLNDRYLEQIREIARERLSGTQHFIVVNEAMRLAVTLGDPDLRRTVETIATNRAAAEALVSPYASDGTLSRFTGGNINYVQERARVLLAGPVDFGPVRRRLSGPPR